MSSITERIKEIYLNLSKFKGYLVKHPATVEFKRELSKLSQRFFSWTMNTFILLAILNIFLMILSPSPDFDKIINIGERGALFLVAITGLTFTYADALESPKKESIIKSGEYLFKSFLLFVVGMVFSINLRRALINPINTWGMPDLIFNYNNILILLLFLTSLVIIIVSGVLFVKAMTGLLASIR
jgi:hypothetical protein